MGRNYKVMKQIDFSGGMNAETPDALSSDTQLRRIVNLLPSEDGNALVLRPAFEAYPNIPTGALSSSAKIISIFPFKGWSSDEALEVNQTNIWQDDNLMVAYDTGTNIVVQRFIPMDDGEERYPLGESKITTDMIWTDAGTDTTDDVIDTGGGTPTFTPYSMRFDNRMLVWLDNSNATVRQLMMDDYWVAENASALYGDGTTDKMGENDSAWIGEDWAFAYDEVTSDWTDPIGTTQARAFDIWSTVVTVSRVNTSIEILFPYSYATVDTDTVGITQKQPRASKVTFRYSFPEVNTPASILFSKASSVDTAIRYVVSYKPQASPDTPANWTVATKLNGVATPVVCYNQSAGQYTEETVDGTAYVKVPFVVPHKDLDIRITALPSEVNPGNMTYEGAAVYLKVG